MKTKVALIILLLVCLGLAGGLLHLNQKAEEQHKEDVVVINQHSNEWVNTSKSLEEERQNNLKLAKDVADRKEDINRLSNDLTKSSESLARTESALKAAQAETAKRDARIAELENQKASLDKDATALRASITSLEGRISDTQKKLAAADGDRSFLQKELNRLMAEKTELERKFIDLDVLRVQVRKLKDELASARLNQWRLDGVYENSSRKGAEKLMQVGPTATVRSNAAPQNSDLNVEVKSTGGTRIVPPVNTNPPPAAPKPPVTPSATPAGAPPIVIIKPSVPPAAPATNAPPVPKQP